MFVRRAIAIGARAESTARLLAMAVSALVALLALLVLLAPGTARANGAFPESLQLLLPADRPEQIALATNFGLIISDDGGATWTWTCEQRETLMGNLYAVGPPPRDRYFSLSPLLGLAYSDDASCTWRTSGGALAVALAKDFFPDPADPAHVLAIGATAVGSSSTWQVFESRDGGETFGDAIYTAPDGGTLLGVENALSDPATIYLALYTTTLTTPSVHPELVRTTNGGADWVTTDIEPFLGSTKFRIIAVDPVDPLTLYARVIDLTSESVAVSKDGGLTFAKPITVANGVITSFARLPDGTVLVGALNATDPLGFRSTDGGASFQNWPVPHLRALGVRDGKLYAAAKNFTDGWAIGVSTDGGVTFTPFISYDKVDSIRPCARAVCEEACDFQAGGGLWPATVCHPSDGGAGGAPPVTSGKGCGCGAGRAAAGATGAGVPTALAAMALAVALAAARRKRR